MEGEDKGFAKGGASVEGTKVLIGDDDPNVCEIIRLYFQKQNLHVLEARNGEEVLALMEREKPDVVLLDVMMPGKDGFEVCREIRQRWDVPIIMLTAKDDEVDRVLGLELGADDYVTKPFSPRELVARIKAIFRRMDRQAKADDDGRPHLVFPRLEIDGRRRLVLVDGKPVPLRPKEFDLLLFLASSPGTVFTRDELLEQVWGYDYFGDTRTVDAHVKKVRQALKAIQPPCIQTVWGVGYKFEVPGDGGMET